MSASTGTPTTDTAPRTDASGAVDGRAFSPGRVAFVAIVGVLALLPFVPFGIPVLFDGGFDSPGVLNLLGLCLVFAALALTYDLLFGFTGLLSFGHALYFGLGVYTTAIALAEFELTLLPAVGLTVVAGLVVPLVLGAICLRVGDIAFAMVTLAFAQAGAIFVLRDPFRLTGGEEGLALAFRQVPGALVGVVNTRNLYWIALAFAVVVWAVSRWAVDSRAGRVWQAIRDNERRVEVMGLGTYRFKLLSFVLASFLATIGGVVYLLLVGGASPGVTTATFTLTLLVMVVLGGTGTLWGAMLGGALYTYLDHRFVELSASDAVGGLPDAIARPLSEPLFLLGTLFVLLVMFFPGGIAGLREAGPARRVRGMVDRVWPGRGAPRDIRPKPAGDDDEVQR